MMEKKNLDTHNALRHKKIITQRVIFETAFKQEFDGYKNALIGLS